MIKNWNIFSRAGQPGTMQYVLLMDGTEQEARVLMRKLQGYVVSLQKASAPYTYSLVLPLNIDKETLGKIRSAAQEGVQQANKVSQFAPDGPLGDPLFNTAANSASPVAPSGPVPPSKSTKDPVPSTISINDNDMLIKDMEGSMLEKMPLKDILSANTKYDMFVDVVKTPQENQKAQADKAQKIQAAQSENTNSFNVFEQEVKDPTNIIDIEDVQDITDRLTTKTMDFIKQPNTPQGPQPASSNAGSHTNAQADSEVPFTLGASLEEEQPDYVQEPATNGIPEEEKLATTLSVFVQPEDEIQLQEKTENAFHAEAEVDPNQPRVTEQPSQTIPQTGHPAQHIQEEAPHLGKTVLRLRKLAAQEPVQSEEEMGKTMLRLRRKQAGATQTPIQPLKSTISPERAAEQSRLAKQTAIDHSIQIPTSELKKHNWPLEVPLVPTYTLNNMVMSVNRFAHATAISVIESPGQAYNPLVLHGGTGTGKTHFLNALAYSFSKKFGQEHIFMTNGVRLSRGIQRYVMEGNINKFDRFMESVQVLLIDDIHLLAINEQNREYISKLLKTFVQKNKQIVITSKYPPASLAKLEELIDFKLDSGWISELKAATGISRFRIIKKMLLESGVDLNDRQIEEFFSGNHMTLGTITRSIRRLKVLENLITALPDSQKSQVNLFEKLLATKGEDPNSELMDKDPQTITSLSTIGNGEWGRIGFFYPHDCTDMMPWMVYALQQRARELGIEGGFEIAVRSSYATENIISSAFKIANLCDNKKLKGAVILGPMPQTCDPSVRENFYDILTHMLEIMLIRCGIINYESARMPSTYVKVISELMR